MSEGHYFGRKRSEMRAGGLILSECSYLPDSAIPRHVHENPYMILSLAGTQRETCADEHHFYKTHTITIHPAQEPHSQKIGSTGFRCLHVEFGADWDKRNPLVSRLLKKRAHFQQSDLQWSMAGIYQEFLFRDDISTVAIEGVLLTGLSEIYRGSVSEMSRPAAYWLRKARDILNDRYAESLSLQDIGDCVGVHPVHLAREFRAHYHTTVAAYIRKLRIKSACTAIAEGVLPLGQIAMECGFADQAHFCKVFKRVVGLSPGQFRSKMILR